MIDHFKRFIRLLNEHKVKYVILGGQDDLLKNKKAVGRPKDLEDIDKLTDKDDE